MQARPEISRKYGGTGLGLAICKSLLDLQQGNIRVESTEGKGSSFCFTVAYEVAAALSLESTATPQEEKNTLEGKKILVAEDVQINQYLIRHFFNGLNCRLKFVDNGRKAVEEVQENEYDLVLMDIQMPEMDGMEATREIRANADEQKACIPIIALTANALKGADARYLAAGMDNYLSKPYTREKLLQVIRQTMQQCEEKKEAAATTQEIILQ
jgi:CheY-like chemotaxis protein